MGAVTTKVSSFGVVSTTFYTLLNYIKENDGDNLNVCEVDCLDGKYTIPFLKRGYIKETDTQIFYYDKLFEDLLNDDNSYKDLLCIIHYIIPRVVKRDFKDDDGNVIENKYGYFKSSIESNLHKLKNPIENLWNFEDDFER